MQKEIKNINFIETITTFGNDALVPINRIKFINFSYEKGYIIKIFSDDGEWHEGFGEDEENAKKRYNIIKKIIRAK